MKISSSAIEQTASHSYSEKHTKRESLTYWNDTGDRVNISNYQDGQNIQVEKEVSFQQQGKSLTSGKPATIRTATVLAEPVPEDKEIVSDLNILILKELIERYTGRKISIFDPAAFGDAAAGQPAAQNKSVEAEPIGQEQPDSGFGLIYEYSESYHEKEMMSFSSTGSVKTEDGQTIDISVSLNMTREFYTSQSLNIRQGDALKDPLVINFGGTAAQLTQRDFYFDIDADGEKDQISFVTPDSGFLALDKNGDQEINDGSELFGALTGDGFGELSVHDTDQNGWIDENDPIYDKLRIWVREGGESKLAALGQVGVGAIYLGHIETPFTIKDEQNQMQGQVRSTGTFLHEDGKAGTIQQIDLVA